MKPFPVLAVFAAALVLSGCEGTLPESVGSVLGPREAPRSRVFQADPRAAYAAVRAAAEEMGFHYVHGGPAEGRFDALSSISPGEQVGGSQQISMKVRLDAGPESGTEVTISLVEILEADSNGRTGVATESALKDTPLYEVFFRGVDQQLRNPPKP